MKIRVKDIPLDGLVIQKTIPPEAIDLAPGDIPCVTPLTLDGLVEKAGSEILAEVQVSADYQFECSRCLTPVRLERVDSLQIAIDIDPDTLVVDLGDEIRQELITRVPIAVQCRPDCKGLCMTCGVNLNTSSCDCPVREPEEHKHIPL